MKTQVTTVQSGVYVEETSVSPVYQGYQILRWGFTVAPIIAGVDKFFDKLTNWSQYLYPPFANLAGGAHNFMMIVGAIEILAGFLVAFKPKIGGYIVAAWLAGIIVNLLLLQNYYDIALRDLGLCLGALALGRLSMQFDHPRVTTTSN
jgi:hypothetical protein